MADRKETKRTTQEVHVFVAVSEGEDTRPFALAAIEGEEGRSSLHLFHVDSPSVADAVAYALNALGMCADDSSTINVKSITHDGPAELFFKEIGAGFDKTFPKGIGDA